MNVPKTMTAVVLTGHGGFDKLAYRLDWPTPLPQPGEILIRVMACGLNNTDINTRTAWYSPTVTMGTNEGGPAGSDDVVNDQGDWTGGGIDFPRIQGADIVGRVAAVGEGLSDEWLGARVMVDPWLRDWSNPMNRYQTGFAGSECDGGFAQYVAMPERQIYRIDSSWSDEELATFPCAYITAENMLTRARVSKGETLLITGASGGVGSALVQLAKRRGAVVLALAGASKVEQVKAVGADAVFPRDIDDLSAAIAEVTGAPSIDVVADVVAGPIFETLLEALHRGGRYVTAGAIAGPIVKLDVRTLYLKDLELIGATVPTPEIFPTLLRYIEAQEIKPLLAKSYPLAEIRLAQQDFLDKKFVGKLVLSLPKG